MKKIIFIIILLSIPAMLSLTKPGFFPTQDFIYVARVFEMNQSLLDGQFPVRWVSDFRYGEPLFNFYAPLPYYAGAIIKNFGFGYLVTVKILFGLGFILSGIAMYFLAKEFFGKIGGLLSAVLYIYAPYHSADVYVRGALSESWALIFFPLIFLTSFKLSEKACLRNSLWLGLSLAGLFFTHNIMTILFMPFFIGWSLFLLLKDGQLPKLKYFILSFILGVGLASSFLLPAFFEKDLVQSNKLITGYFDFRGHFVAIPQFFSTFWGYGASLWGSQDDMSFQVGLVHWAALFMSLGLLIFRKSKKTLLLVLFIMLEFLFSLFMQHNRSAPIWEALPIMWFTQFPWRFLGISIFLISFLGGSIALYLKRFYWISFILIAIIIVANFNYFKPDSYYSDSTDVHYVSQEVLAIDDKLPKDYLPIWVKRIEKEKKDAPYAVEGKIEISDFKKRSSSASFKTNVLESGEVEVPITYFPGWQAKVNGKEVKIEDPSELGLIKFKLPMGSHKIDLSFNDAPIRSLGNMISLISFFVIIILFIKTRHLKS